MGEKGLPGLALHYQTPPRAIADDLGFHRKLGKRDEEEEHTPPPPVIIT